ncbi:YceD family protein [Sulfurivirga sp.]|uniref:YceD family protein n=1 Tax=Sulfurivirga sp. TaxID=2614236 RepID=UPI0025EE0B5F|nr:YceD family protein [Sulfurivirga sp.]
MAKPMPDWIEPEQAARQNRQYQLSLDVRQFPRLMAALDDRLPPSPIEMTLRFFMEPESRRPAFELTMQGDMPLQCQRTLDAYRQPVDEKLTAVFVASEGEAEWVPEAYDAWLLDAGERINPWRLIEDELLLAIPMVPRQPGEPLVWQDHDRTPAPVADEENPFAVLAALRSGNDEEPKH